MTDDGFEVRKLGDCYVGVEFGEAAKLAHSFRVLALYQSLLAEPLDGLIDVIPSMREIAVTFDRTAARPDQVEAGLRERLAGLGEEATLRSRRFVLPVWYDDPWSHGLAAANGEPVGLELVAGELGVAVAEVIGRHSGTDHWCACVGWGPGCYFCYPLDAAMAISAPKLASPREFCHARILTMGGVCTAAMPKDGPSGYSMLGRLAVNIYEPRPRFSIFPANGVLFRAGDRHRYRPVEREEYEEVEAAVTAGTYEYEVAEESFDVAAYLAGA